MEGDFYFVPPPLVAAASSAQPTVTLEGVFWDSIKTSRDPADFKAYLVQFPKGVFAELAQNRLAALQQETSSDSKPATSSPKTAPTSQAANALQATQSPVVAPPVPLSQQGSAVSPRPNSPLENSEVAVLLARARALIANGDIPSARLVLRRADEHGDARAALELGGTYDPLVLKQIYVNIVNSYADAVQARKWYERAAYLGSTDALQRLKALALLNQ